MEWYEFELTGTTSKKGTCRREKIDYLFKMVAVAMTAKKMLIQNAGVSQRSR